VKIRFEDGQWKKLFKLKISEIIRVIGLREKDTKIKEILWNFVGNVMEVINKIFFYKFIIFIIVIIFYNFIIIFIIFNINIISILFYNYLIFIFIIF